MNRDDLLKVRAALEVLPPERFDYREALSENCGCVLIVMERLIPIINSTYTRALGIDNGSLAYLIGYANARIDASAKDFTEMADAEATGAAGIAEAIRRIDVLLAREEEGA